MIDILVIGFAVLVSVGVLILVLEPVWRATLPAAEQSALDEQAEILEDLYARRDTLYASIRELEFDHQVGKITDEDYKRLRARLTREAADLLRHIEEVKSTQSAVRERLEARVRDLLQRTSAAVQATTPVADAASPPVAEEPRFCTQCGAPLVPGARFCSQCGAAVRRTKPAL